MRNVKYTKHWYVCWALVPAVFVLTFPLFTGAEVNNEISSLRDRFDLQVIYPVPRNIQLAMPDGGLDLPTCIPDDGQPWMSSNDLEEFKDLDRKTRISQTFAVFVNTSFHLEAMVSSGNNLTFTFDFEDMEEVMDIKPCEECLSASQVSVGFVLELGQIDKN